MAEKKVKRARGITLFITACLGLGFSFFTLASATDGTIDSTYKYAWGTKIGWLNFGTTDGNVHITNSTLTGKIWNDNYGWIDLAPTYSGVTNNGQGILSGYAWGANTGWINFDGVSIGCNGQFSGTATAVNTDYGTISFNCSNCTVTTDWRASNCGETTTPPGGGAWCGDGYCSGGGGGETCTNCATDCGVCVPECGDKTCNGDETCATCTKDCGKCEPECGDKTCDSTENCESCTKDCGKCEPEPECGDKKCNGDETCATCPDDCKNCKPTCGDDECDSKESCADCPEDCGICKPTCGDKICNAEEDCESCSEDCKCEPKPGCGNKKCEGDETCQNCPEDCGGCKPQPVCGDNSCNGNESCASCPNDCGVCDTTTPTEPACGDGTCDKGESCSNCPNDCSSGCNQPIPFLPPGGIIQDTAGQVAKGAVEGAKAVKKIVETPVGAVATKVASTTGVVTVGVSIAFASPLTLPEMLLIPTRLMGLLLVAFGIKKRKLPWGVVYDSITKQPLDPAYVIIKDLQGNEVSSAITDLDGRYGFLVNPGQYIMEANKTNYTFPSKKLGGMASDELYNNLYFGETLQYESGSVVMKNIPLDQINFDWNEFAKKDKNLMMFYSKWDTIFRKISDLFFVVGFFIAIIAALAAPYPYNTIILLIYFFLLFLRIIGIKPKAFGSIVERGTGRPLSFSIVKIIEAASNVEVARKVTDKYGRYYCLVPRGEYRVNIEKKNDDGSYSLAYSSPVLNTTKKGIIKERFEV